MNNNNNNNDNKNNVVDKKKCKPSDFKMGEWLSGTIYYKILNNAHGKHQVIDNFGRTLYVGNNILGREMYSSKQFEEEKKVNRTEMANILMNAGDTVFTARFKKKINGKRVRDKLEEEKYENAPPSKKQKICSNALENGEDRELTGFLSSSEPNMGRSNVIDLNVNGSFKNRLIDHRTLYEIIIKNTKYILK